MRSARGVVCKIIHIPLYGAGLSLAFLPTTTRTPYAIAHKSPAILAVDFRVDGVADAAHDVAENVGRGLLWVVLHV